VGTKTAIYFTAVKTTYCIYISIQIRMKFKSKETPTASCQNKVCICFVSLKNVLIKTKTGGGGGGTHGQNVFVSLKICNSEYSSLKFSSTAEIVLMPFLRVQRKEIISSCAKDAKPWCEYPKMGELPTFNTNIKSKKVKAIPVRGRGGL
jgi:Na+-translocating ferredoxin:NAD+ oxidoreductase RnfC subunit